MSLSGGVTKLELKALELRSYRNFPNRSPLYILPPSDPIRLDYMALSAV